MSLDIYLYADEPVMQVRQSIYVRKSGRTKEVSKEEFDQMLPEGMELRSVEEERNKLYWANITHNLGKMASEVNITPDVSLYKALWRHEELNIEKAKDLIPYLREGLEILGKDPEFFKQYDAPNRWGAYDQFVSFVRQCLEACEKYPEAEVEASY